ncbi:MAG: DUF6600 domain-containing protein [Gammaproteobacteria bacterium]
MQMPVRNGFSLARVGARAVLWILASSLGAVAMGQDGTPDVPDDSTDTSDEVAPERVARLSFTQGGVSLQGVGETVWAPATLNRPLTPGDFLRTETDGRAEIQVGSADIRMGAGTSFAFTTLDDDAIRMRLGAGVLNLRVRTLGENEAIEVETPQATAAILRPGSYRLEVNPDGGSTVVKVGSGMLEARGSAEQSFVVRAQQVATLTGKGRLTFATATLGAPDSFDQWALERDRRDDYVLSTEPARSMPADVVGYEDLDKYGAWRSEPDYGYVWTPGSVAADWSPYRFGRYSYVSGWGWAWIDDAPWGFAPYHYGQWVTIGNRWSWVPGPRHGRPVGRPVGSPVVGRPTGPRDHGWHTPRPPRGYTVQSGVPASDVTRIGTRPGFVSSDDLNRRDTWRDRNGGARNNAGRYRTVPDRAPSGTPPTSVPRASAPRAEEPRRSGPRYNTGGSSFPSQQRPSSPPAQQPSRPVQSQPAQQSQPRPAPSAGVDRSVGSRPKATQER